MDCSCAPMFRFFSVASDGATTDRQILNRVFWSIFYQFEEGYHRQLCIDLDTFYDIYYRTGSSSNLGLQQGEIVFPPVNHF